MRRHHLQQVDCASDHAPAWWIALSTRWPAGPRLASIAFPRILRSRLGVPLRNVCPNIGDKSAPRDLWARILFPPIEAPAWAGITPINNPGNKEQKRCFPASGLGSSQPE